MKRAHRRTHLLIWLILGPAMIAALLLAVRYRPDAPVNNTLPETVLEAPADVT
jgi:hypothetical protein